ncbi:MAG TPA: hypothetical protein VFJ81_07690, partial [Gemmatimonadales bacterium]|nr:hypothetical protein [Gemmatimonadales bacterium]
QPERLRELATRPPRYVAEVPRRRAGWLERPRLVTRPDPTNRRGRGPKVPRLAVSFRRACKK